MENKILGLLKIGKQLHIEASLREGELLLRTLDYFKKMEKDEQRKDGAEGSLSLSQIPWLKIKLDSGIEMELSIKEDSPIRLEKPGKLRTYDPGLLGNVYCMHSFTTNLCRLANTVDKRNYEFGDSFVLILNVKAFVDRVCEGLKKKRLKPEFNLVRYYDESHEHPKLGYFHKPDRFQHQNEFRFFVYNNKNKDIKINIGSIQDIAIMGPIEVLEKMIFKLRDDGLIMFGFPED